ncbi:membrane-spanning protein [Heyndrickxia acidicola]|uniref:Membrane-spanning protein n=1 Tax=Heyndrickxia acidicola TaxID=209389 RepID=A0ABU6MM50_9BACI|nr:membrane-spanning protein [Heyndrickxia acidicola]MED1204703.1 membrane-spanning protein [Heyndrickxia acidicola]
MKRTVLITLAAAFMLFMAIVMVIFIIKGERTQWLLAMSGIIVGSLPLGLLFAKRIPFPTLAIIGFYFFMVWSLFFGSILGFYTKYKWWDTPMHFYKGAYLSLIAITIYKLLIPYSERKNLSKWALFLFCLGLSMAASTLWEIWEYTGDLLVTNIMQLGGNFDTMEDLTAGCIGAMLASIYAGVRKQRV